MKICISFLMFFLIFSNAYSQQMNIIPLEFNSIGDDFGASISNNGRKIFYTSSKKGKQQIYFSEKLGNGWSLSNETSSELNIGEQIGFPTLTQDGNIMIFAAFESKVKGSGRTDLFSSKKVNGEWTEIKNLNSIINSEFWDSQPCLSADGNILFFVSDRPGGLGGTDIYYSLKQDGEWQKPKNAGPKINSEFNEMTPNLALDNKIFTFASNRPDGLGGFDIYYSIFQNNDFSINKHLDRPFNSDFDEFSYILIPYSNSAIFTSNRPLSSGKLDLYLIKENPLKLGNIELLTGSIFDINTNETVFGQITIVNASDNEKKILIETDDKDGSFYAVLELAQDYYITATAKDYLFKTLLFSTLSETDGKEKGITFELSPLIKGVTRLLVFFEEGNYNILESSFYDLNKVVDFLKENSSLNIALFGHSFELGGDLINENISLKRANSVKEYIVNQGIDAARIRTKGFGKSKPLNSENSDEAKKQNSRIEMQVLGE